MNDMEQEFQEFANLLPSVTRDPDRSKLLSLLAIMGYNKMELFTQDECGRAADRLRDYQAATGADSEVVRVAIRRLEDLERRKII